MAPICVSASGPGTATAHSDRAVIRAARGRLAPSALCDPARRDARKRFYRDMLQHHADAQRLVMQFRL